MKNNLIDSFKDNIGIEKLFEIFLRENIKIFLVGGCIRNALLNISVKDIDFAVACSPKKIISIILKNKLNYNDFAIKYGSIQVIINKEKYQITSLREDLNQTGRHTDVRYTESLKKDALRRDFTINSIYLSPEGKLYDFFNGYTDILNSKVRFIGNVKTRVREDYLRIFRYYRFLGCFQKIKLIPGYKKIIDKEILNIKHKLNNDIIRLEIIKMLKNVYPQNSFIDTKRPYQKNNLVKEVIKLWNQRNYKLGNKCLKEIYKFFD